MDTINHGGERPHLLMCGTNGSFLTRRENSIPCEDILGKNRARKIGLAFGISQEIFRIFLFATQNCAFITIQNLLFLYSVFYCMEYTDICFWRPLKLALMHNRKNSKFYPEYDVYFMSFCTNICISSVLVRQHEHVVSAFHVTCH